MKKFIVAEVTKNWTSATPATNLISMQFEDIINKNAERGYLLVDWKMNVAARNDLLTETIIAIFEKYPKTNES